MMQSIKHHPLIREEKRQWFNRKLSEAENYFKHADKDPDASFEFCPELTRFFLFDAIQLYYGLTQCLFHEALLYRIWFSLKYPDTLEPGFAKCFYPRS